LLTKFVVVSERIAFRLSHTTGEKVFDRSLKRSKDRESESHIEPDSNKAGTYSVVEAQNTMLSVNLAEAVWKSVVFVRFYSLHLGFNHVNGVVAQGWAEASEYTSNEINNNFAIWKLLKYPLGVTKDDESYSLVGWLLKESREGSFVDSHNALCLRDRVNTVENTSVFGVSTKLVVYEFGL